jgi:hypothetical protein
MKIYYTDEYGTTLFRTEDAEFVPTVGDMVVIADDDPYRVKSRTYYTASDSVIVEITQNMVKTQASMASDNTMTNEMRLAIANVNKRQDAGEKRTRALNEQVTTVRKHINQQIQQAKKDSNDR